jgi:hypothetical protein
MSQKFNNSLIGYGLKKLKQLKPFKIQWNFGKSGDAPWPEEPNAPSDSAPPPSAPTGEQSKAEGESKGEEHTQVEERSNDEEQAEAISHIEEQPKA